MVISQNQRSDQWTFHFLLCYFTLSDILNHVKDILRQIVLVLATQSLYSYHFPACISKESHQNWTLIGFNETGGAVQTGFML